MVKLIFNPKNETKKTVLESKSSLKVIKNEVKNEVEINFNPFKGVTNEFVQLSQNNSIKENGLCTKDLVGLENCHYVLKDWYTKYKKDSKFLLIIGPTGCGKSTLIELFSKEEDIKLLNLKINDNKTKKDLLKEIDLFIDYSSEFFFKTTKDKKLIFIDEYQNGQNDILSTTDLTELKDKGVPIIIISADSKGSKLSDFKKGCEVYYINEIPQGMLKTWIISLKPSLSDTQVNYISENCKSDKRLILNALNFIENSSKTVIDSFLKNYQKDMDINIFEITKRLFNTDPFDINEIFKVYDTDGFVISNLVHENYIDYNQDIHDIAKAADCISSGEILFSDTYESCKSFLPDAHCINSIILPCFYAKSELNSKGTVRSSIINNRFNILLGNKKNIAKINGTNYHKIDIFDIYTFKSILNQELIKSKIQQPNKIEFVKKILKSIEQNNDKGMEKLEMIYKHFTDFKQLNEKEVKTKSFTIKFKEKIR
jgi:hypothetical protein